MRTLIWILMGIVLVFVFWPAGEKAETPSTPNGSAVASPMPAPVSSAVAIPSSEISFPVFPSPEAKPMVLSQPRGPSVRLPGQVFEPATTVESPHFIRSSPPPQGRNALAQPPHLVGEPPILRRRR